jgi:hypothetical protein
MSHRSASPATRYGLRRTSPGAGISTVAAATVIAPPRVTCKVREARLAELYQYSSTVGLASHFVNRGTPCRPLA